VALPAAPDTGDKSGNPPSLIRLRDDRLAMTYGHRALEPALFWASRPQKHKFADFSARRSLPEAERRARRRQVFRRSSVNLLVFYCFSKMRPGPELCRL